MDLLDTLYVTTPGTSLHLEGGAIRVVHPDLPGRHLVPALRLEALVLWGGVSASPDVLRHCAETGVHVTWITQNGRLIASIAGDEPGRGELRLAQYRAFDDVDHRVELSKRFLAGKLQGYRQLLLRTARDAEPARQARLRQVAAVHSEALEKLAASTNLTECLGIEGRAARAYFSSADLVFTKESTRGRSKPPPLDPVNCYLSMGYALLRTSVHAALVHAGLDPMIGFMHGVRGTKPSLALDLMEEMRPLLVDRLVATLVNRGQLEGPKHTRELPGGGYEFTQDGARLFLNEWASSRQRLWPHKGLGRSIPAAQIPILQARLLARHLREPSFDYEPWQVA